MNISFQLMWMFSIKTMFSEVFISIGSSNWIGRKDSSFLSSLFPVTRRKIWILLKRIHSKWRHCPSSCLPPSPFDLNMENGLDWTSMAKKDFTFIWWRTSLHWQMFVEKRLTTVRFRSSIERIFMSIEKRSVRLSLSLFSRLCWGERFSSLNRQTLTTTISTWNWWRFVISGEKKIFSFIFPLGDRFSIWNCSIVKMKNLLIFLPILRWSMNEFLLSDPIDCWRFHRWAIISIQDGMEREREKRRFYPNTDLIQLDITLKRKIFDQRQFFFFFFFFFNLDKQRFLFERTERKEKKRFLFAENSSFIPGRLGGNPSWKMFISLFSFLLSMDSKRFSSTWSFVIHRLESVQSNLLDSISLSNWEEKEEEELAVETNSHFHELSSFISVQCSSMTNERSIV